MRKTKKPKTRRRENEEKSSYSGKKLDFVAVDVETANSDISSICQIGIAVVRSSRIIDVWTQLIDPNDFFDPYNTAIHSIDGNMVRGCPKFEEICDKIAGYLGEVVVSHTLFDQRALSKAFRKSGKPFYCKTWIDSAQVARRAWPDKYSIRGYNLGNVARDLGIRFRHHDAGEDARAAAEIILKACITTPEIDKMLDMDSRSKSKKRRAKTRSNSVT